jgi:sulfatase-like protein
MRMPGETRSAPRLYPFLASAYLVVALAAVNGGELIEPAELYRPLLISLAIALGAWLLTRLVTKDRDRRALLTLALVLVFGVFGRVSTFLTGLPQVAEFGTDTVALPLTFILLVAFSDLVRRYRYSFGLLSHYLNLVTGILLVWSAGQFVWHTRAAQDAKPLGSLEQASSGPALAGDVKPHFFFIVLDKYTGPRSLRSNYGFDETQFLEFLERKGFEVPRRAHANYNHTFLALAAMLNWQYLDTLAATLGEDNPSWRAAYPVIEDNRLARTLKRAGYRFVFFPTTFAPTKRNRYADQQLPNPASITPEFQSVWLSTTILPTFLGAICPWIGCSTGDVPYMPESAASLDWKFKRLPELAEGKEPVFVFAHLTVPHEPYIYDAKCGHRRPYWPDRDDGAEAAKVKAAYIDQVSCTNAKVERLVTDILSRARRQTIIVLQADHGHGRLGRGQPALAEALPWQVAERMDIFAAYFLPDHPEGLISDSVGPVNAIRAIMRHYYSLPLPLLPEKTFWASSARPYAFTRIR